VVSAALPDVIAVVPAELVVNLLEALQDKAPVPFATGDEGR
jgi:hypothetical protein